MDRTPSKIKVAAAGCTERWDSIRRIGIAADRAFPAVTELGSLGSSRALTQELNAQQTTKTKCCCSKKAISMSSIISIFRSTGIVMSISTAIGAAAGAVVGAAINDMASGVAWGFAAGAFASSILITTGLIKIKSQ